MVRVVVLYERAPDADRYERHAELCRRVPGATFRHGSVMRTLHGGPDYAYYAEFEFPDMQSFQRVAAGDEFRATGRDAGDMALPNSVYLLELA